MQVSMLYLQFRAKPMSGKIKPQEITLQNFMVEFVSKCLFFINPDEKLVDMGHDFIIDMRRPLGAFLDQKLYLRFELLKMAA